METSELTRGAEQLALAVYRLTSTFPPAEPLRKKLRQTAVEITLMLARPGQTSLVKEQEIVARFEAMAILLRLAEPQGFAGQKNFAVLKTHYEALRKDATADAAVKRSAKVNPGNSRQETAEAEAAAALNARQKKIIQHFRHRPSFQLREARTLFEGYSQKTLRNDLKKLCQAGVLNREGIGTVSFYRVVAVRPFGAV